MIAVSEVERLSKNADRDPALMTARKELQAMGVDVTNALLKADGQRGVQGSFNSFVDHVAERGPPRLTNGSHLVPVFHPGHLGWVVNRKRAKRTSDEQNIADWSVALRYV